jgi:hypothetical protein
MVKIDPAKPPKSWRKPPTQASAFTIDEFCQHHRLSPSTYFKMRADGLGPKEMIVGTRRMISQEAAAKWRRQREAAVASTA